MCRDQWSRRHPLIDRAIRIALAERAPTALIFPSDVLDLTYDPPRQAFKQVPSSLGVTSATPAPDPDAVSRAAEILNSGERVAMLVGQGARGCAPELITVADILGAGCAKALLGREVLPDTLPWVTGSIGLLGTTASHRLMSGCDTLLTVGSKLPYSQFLPSFGQARGVQIDHSPELIGMRYRMSSMSSATHAPRCKLSSRCSNPRPTARGATRSKPKSSAGGRMRPARR